MLILGWDLCSTYRGIHVNCAFDTYTAVVSRLFVGIRM
jgi:hypothetical protein